MHRSVHRSLTLGAGLLTSYLLTVGLATTASAANVDDPDAGAAGRAMCGAPFFGARLVPTADGATVAHVVADGPADDAGLEVGDIVRSIDGVDIDRKGALREALAGTQPGDELTVVVDHGGSSLSLTLVVGEPSERPEPPAVEDVPWVGARLVRAEDGGGVLVRSVLADSPADAAGLESGDIVTSIDGTEVTEWWQAQEALRGYAPGDVATLSVERDGKAITVELELGSAADAPAPRGHMGADDGGGRDRIGNGSGMGDGRRMRDGSGMRDQEA